MYIIYSTHGLISLFIQVFLMEQNIVSFFLQATVVSSHYSCLQHEISLQHLSTQLVIWFSSNECWCHNPTLYIRCY